MGTSPSNPAPVASLGVAQLATMRAIAAGTFVRATGADDDEALVALPSWAWSRSPRSPCVGHEILTDAGTLVLVFEEVCAELATVTEERDSLVEGRRHLLVSRAASQGSLDRLRARFDEVEAERDKLLLALAAERGEPEGAPSSGWRWTGAVWFHPRTLMVVQPDGRLWRINPDQADARAYPREPMGARAAMQAADAAVGVVAP